MTLLLAMQAAGMVTDYLGTKSQADMLKMGLKVQQASLESNLEQNRLEAANESLSSMKQLRQTIGSQIAVMAARGTFTGAGSAASLLNESVGNFNSDERIRRINALGRENQLRGNSAMSRLQYSSDVSKLWQGFASRTINNFSTNSEAWGKAFGITSKAGA